MEKNEDFYIRITGRKQNTWQGIIVKGKCTFPFNSELELLHLIEEQIELSSQTDNSSTVTQADKIGSKTGCETGEFEVYDLPVY